MRSFSFNPTIWSIFIMYHSDNLQYISCCMHFLFLCFFQTKIDKTLVSTIFEDGTTKRQTSFCG